MQELLEGIWMAYNEVIDSSLRSANEYAKDKEQQVSAITLKVLDKFHEKMRQHEDSFAQLRRELKEQELANVKMADKVQKYRSDYLKLSEEHIALKRKHEEIQKLNQRLDQANNALKLLFMQPKAARKGTPFSYSLSLYQTGRNHPG